MPDWIPRSDNMPEITWAPPISDLFANLGVNFWTLKPVLALLFGIIFAFYVAKKLKNTFIGDDDDDK